MTDSILSVGHLLLRSNTHKSPRAGGKGGPAIVPSCQVQGDASLALAFSNAERAQANASVLDKDCRIEFGDVAAMQLDKPLEFLLAAALISGQVAFG